MGGQGLSRKADPEAENSERCPGKQRVEGTVFGAEGPVCMKARSRCMAGIMPHPPES